MPWELISTDHLRTLYGADDLCGFAERLKDVLDQNAMPVPEFPAMIWTRESLPSGEEITVGIAEDQGESLAYIWPANKIEFIETEAVTLEYQSEAGPRSVVVQRYRPTDE